MDTKYIIGHKIKDILVWSKIEVGGLDEAEVFIELENGITIGIPWRFESKNIERSVRKDAKSLFADLNDYPVYHINPEEKTIDEVLEAKKKREASLIGRIKKIFGIEEGIFKEYRIHKTGFRENKLKYIMNQEITDFIMFDNSDSVGFIELGNGYIITETRVAPNGTGLAGFNYYESLKDFESSCGADYKRFKNKSD